MKEDKLICENEKAIEDFTVIEKINLKESHPLVIEETEEKFVIVNDFSAKAKSGGNIKLSNQSDSENREESFDLVYAEEIIDDEDDNDLYDEALHDRAIEKQRHRSYLEIGQEIDTTLDKNGFSGQIGFSLITAMKFSRLLYVQNNENLEQALRSLVGTFGTPFYSMKYIDGLNIASTDEIYNIFAFAKKNINRPVFIYVGAMEATHLIEHLKPLYGYIDNPDGDNFVTTNGHSMKIPNNIYIIYTLDDDNKCFEVSRKLLRYTARFEVELTQSKVITEGFVPFLLSLEELLASFREATEKFVVDEESWRKVDELIKAINSVNAYSIKNKIQRRLEDTMIVLLSSGKSIDEVIDIALSQFILHEAIITMDPSKYNSVDLVEIIEDAFGNSGMKRSKAVIKQYLSLVTKKGKN